MAVAPQVTVEWRRGVGGTGGTYNFNPIPEIQRNTPNSKRAVFDLPLVDGLVVQELGLAARTVTVRGVLFTTPINFNVLDQLRKDLASGIEDGPGELHIIAPGNHVFYKGIPSAEGIRFNSLERSNILEYTITILTPDPTEFVV